MAGGRLTLSRAGWWLFGAKALRAFAFGWLSVILALYLAGCGLSPQAIGAVFTATIVEDALLTIALSAVAARLGAARVMLLTAPLITVGGVLLAVARTRPWLLAGAVLGTLSPNGQEAGPFSAMEQALLPGLARGAARTRVFGWYNVCGFLPAAGGALGAGAALGAVLRAGIDELTAQRAMLWAYAAAGVLLTLGYARLAALVPGPAPCPADAGARLEFLGLHRSRWLVLQLAGLQGLDAFAGGFIMQSLLAYWLHLRFGVGPEALGALFFGTNVLSAASLLGATRLAERFGLLPTMVFTHLPSNALLLLVPCMPSFGGAAAMLLVRHTLAQMDVPTRQAYTLALVAPDERPAAVGLTASARALAQACAPVLSGAAMTVAASGAPLFIAGGLKIAYDLALFFRFRSVRLDDSDGVLAARRGGVTPPGT